MTTDTIDKVIAYKAMEFSGIIGSYRALLDHAIEIISGETTVFNTKDTVNYMRSRVKELEANFKEVNNTSFTAKP